MNLTCFCFRIIGNFFTAIGHKITILFLVIFLSQTLFAKDKIVFGLTGAIYKSDIKVFQEWEKYIESKDKNLEIEIIYSRTYADMATLITSGKVDIAYICSSTFVSLRDNSLAKLLAIPINHNGTQKHFAYIIAQKSDSYESLFDFKGKVFAFSDPDSKTGSIVPQYFLLSRGADIKTFFKKIIYTYEHEESINAVLSGFVSGASIDSLVFEQFSEKFPDKAKKLTVVQKMGPFTASPIIAKATISQEHFHKLQKILNTMHLDAEGQTILSKLNLTRFDIPTTQKYEDVDAMKYFLEKHK